PVGIGAACHNGMGAPLATLQLQAQHSSNVTSTCGLAFENIATPMGGPPETSPILLLEQVESCHYCMRATTQLRNCQRSPKIKSWSAPLMMMIRIARHFSILAIFGNFWRQFWRFWQFWQFPGLL